MKAYDTYLFDLDGTLINTIELIVLCAEATLKELCNTSIPREAIISRIGTPLRAQYEDHLSSFNINANIEDLMSEHMAFQAQHWQGRIHLYPNVISVLQTLRDRGKALGIVTSRRDPTCSEYMKAMGLSKFFSEIVTPDHTSQYKPHPAPVLKAMENMHAQPDSTIYVGDSQHDIESGRAAGIDTYLVLTGICQQADPHSPPTYVHPTLEPLTDYD